MTSRLLLVHAHPDDETSQTGATLARYAAQAQVTLVTCTMGEEGDIIASDLSHLNSETLGPHRLTELHTAMAALGVTDYVRLGGDYAYRDSGMITDANGNVQAAEEIHPGSFWAADLLEAATHLVEIIRDRRPQVIATYDSFGGYGHPDHIQAHRVAMYAFTLASAASFRPDLGPAWQVSRVLWTAWDADSVPALAQAAQQLGLAESLSGWFDPDGELPPMFIPHHFIGARIDERPWSDAVVKALSAYRSQVDMLDPWWQLVKAAPDIPRYEAYQLAAGLPFPDTGELATDLFAGINTDD